MSTSHAIHHVSDDELTLHFYGEHPQPALVEIHLASCATCAATFEDIVATLALVDDDAPAPVRDEHYGLEVWQRIRPELPTRRPAFAWLWTPWPALGAAAAAALLGVSTFTVGQYWPAATPTVSVAVASAESPAGSADRARLVAVADHLERSERLLLDVSNGEPAAQPADQRAAVADLVDANRLFRDVALQAGDETVAGVLDDLERALLDIVHAPTTLTASELAVVRARLDAAALLFKIRILSNELREREDLPVAPRKTT